MAQLVEDISESQRGSSRSKGPAELPWDASHQVDTTERIVTPENIAFDYYCAGPFARVMAFLVDIAIFFTVWIAFLFIEWMVAIGIAYLSTQLGVFFIFEGLVLLVAGLNLLLVFVSYWLVWGWAESRFNGRTIGKWLLGIRVVTTSGHPISGMQAMTRSILRAVEVLPLVPMYNIVLFFVPPRNLSELVRSQADFGFLAFPTGLVTLLGLMFLPRFQRIGDIVAGTMVVYEHRTRKPGLAKLEDPRTSQLAELIPAAFRPRREMVKAISAYVHRRQYLSSYRRHEIASHIAKPLLVEFGLLPDTSYDLLLCAIYYKLFVATSTQESQSLIEGAMRKGAERGGVL